MTQHDTETWALDTLLVHGDTYLHRAQTMSTPTVLPIYTSTTYLHQ